MMKSFFDFSSVIVDYKNNKLLFTLSKAEFTLKKMVFFGTQAKISFDF